MEIPQSPNYTGRGLVNLMAELEARAGGGSIHHRLDEDLGSIIPEGSTTVLVMFDGLGSHQLTHPFATDLARADAGPLDAPFPTTTTVSLTTVATGRTATEHGVLGYTLIDPEFAGPINTIHLRSVYGDDLGIDPDQFLPGDRLWERLAAEGIEPISVQPANFADTPLTRMLYRGARFEPYHHPAEIAEVTMDLARHAGRFILVYLPFVDVAAHVSGQRSAPYSEAIRLVNDVWMRLADRLSDDTVLLGTADHGHIDIDETHKHTLQDGAYATSSVAGDPRVLFLPGPNPGEPIDLPIDIVDTSAMREWWGPGTPSECFLRRLPGAVGFARGTEAIFTSAMNRRLVGHHGGLTDKERQIPLLVRH